MLYQIVTNVGNITMIVMQEKDEENHRNELKYGDSRKIIKCQK